MKYKGAGRVNKIIKKMFQKGTGERFKYKEAVKSRFHDAKCKKYIYGRNLVSNPFVGYCVTTATKKLSGVKQSAEKAWEDAWIKNIN